jgi:CRISPR/Cas system CMR-associated protein Cmr3 (group 5 of RAMP superfamily)
MTLGRIGGKTFEIKKCLNPVGVCFQYSFNHDLRAQKRRRAVIAVVSGEQCRLAFYSTPEVLYVMCLLWSRG